MEETDAEAHEYSAAMLKIDALADESGPAAFGALCSGENRNPCGRPSKVCGAIRLLGLPSDVVGQKQRPSRSGGSFRPHPRA